jgi:hypothetical protein
MIPVQALRNSPLLPTKLKSALPTTGDVFRYKHVGTQIYCDPYGNMLRHLSFWGVR